ncbi:hypothetical protein [Egicoccus sp. AB-alg6-2]|uniref:hypothetical protein n=1 Tax=Egicoccus sp. AB-alg6-2 TaxID=3242692 RepID=UPI00359D9C14
MIPRPLPVVVLALLLAGCTDSSSASGGTETVEGVSVTVPEGWSVTDPPDAPGVVAARGWSPGRPGHLLQVIVGCEGTVDELVTGAVREPRGPLVVTDATEDRASHRVPGLDEARRLQLTLGAGRPDDADTVRTAGLYGQRGDALVLVELSQLARDVNDELADEVLDSVRVDADALDAACEQQP